MVKKSSEFNTPLIKSFSVGDGFKDILDEKVVYHYTSPEAFVSILKNKCLRFTDVRFMNDKSEGKYIVKLLIEFAEKHYSEYPHFCDAVNGLFNENDFDSLKNMKLEIINYSSIPGLKYIEQRHFLFCLCTEPDLLNMWNYYVHNGTYQGYNIGFNPISLLKTFEVDPNDNYINSFVVYYGRIIYDTAKQEKVISELAAKLERDYNKGNYALGYLMVEIRNFIETKGYFFKSKAFESEKEFRIIICVSDKNVPIKESDKYSGKHNKRICEDVCSKNGVIVPFLNIEFPVDAIRRITISPITEAEIAKAGIKELFKISGIPVSTRVYQSNIPIRF